MFRWLLVVPLLSLMLLGTGSCERLPEYRHYWRTPMGYKVLTIENNVGENQYWHVQGVLEWLDWRIDEWIAMRSAEGRDPAELSRIAFSVEFVIYDDYVFAIGGQNVAGATYDNRVLLSLWSMAQGSVLPPPEAPYYINRYSSGLWYWGVFTPCSDGERRGLAVTGHELDHHIGINH